MNQMAQMASNEHLEFLAKYNKCARFEYVYTEQSMLNYERILQAEPPPVWAAYLSVGASDEQKSEGPWEKLGYWRQTGVSHVLPSGELAIQWSWMYKA